MNTQVTIRPHKGSYLVLPVEYISVLETLASFPDRKEAEQWIEDKRETLISTVRCAHCGQVMRGEYPEDVQVLCNYCEAILASN